MAPSSAAEHDRLPRLSQPRRGAVATAVIVGAALMAGLAWWLVHRAWNRTVAHWRARLSSLATEQQKTIETFLEERRGDAEMVAGYPSVVDLVGHADDPDARHLAHLTQILERLLQTYGYDSILLYNRAGRDLLQLGAYDERPDATAVGQRAMTAGYGVSRLSDRSGRWWLAFAAPVGNEPATGAVVLLMDPRERLAPILRRQDVLAGTGETLLVAGDGDEVIYLSALRLGRADETPLRPPRSRAGALAVAALAGEPKFGVFTDYRGVPVLAATRHIDGTSWALMVKIDRSEALAEYHTEMWPTVVFAGLVVMAFAGFLLALARRQQLQIMARDLAHERTAAEARERYGLLSESVNEIVLFSDQEGRFLEVNRAAERAYGYTREELLRLHIADLRVPSELSTLREQMRQAGERAIVFETTHRRRDGTSFPVEVSATSAAIGDERLFVSIVRDISERKRQEARIAHLQSLLSAIREINQMIVRETDRHRLLQQSCDILLRTRAYGMAWIGVPQPEGSCVRPVASAGDPTGYLASARITWDETPTGWGPTGTAIRTRRPCVVSSIDSDPQMKPWREEALARGFASSAAFPIEFGATLHGALSVCATRPEAFDDEEGALLEQLAGDIGYALHDLAVRDENVRMIEDLRASEERSRRAAEEVLGLNADLERRVGERTAALEAANRELEAFNYSVSHDLRAPLRHIEGFIRILEEDFGTQLPEEAKRYLQRVRAGSERMGQLIDALLQLSRVGRAELQPLSVDLAVIARSAFEELRARAGERAIDFVVGPLPRTTADPTLLRQLLDNLIDNAIKFTRPVAAPRIEIGASGNGAPVYFVRDNGVGFDPRYGDKLFHVFQRLHGPEEFEGTGIGLSIVRRIVEKHGGRVWAEGAAGQGATFYFTLTPDTAPEGAAT